MPPNKGWKRNADDVDVGADRRRNNTRTIRKRPNRTAVLQYTEEGKKRDTCLSSSRECWMHRQRAVQVYCTNATGKMKMGERQIEMEGWGRAMIRRFDGVAFDHLYTHLKRYARWRDNSNDNKKCAFYYTGGMLFCTNWLVGWRACSFDIFGRTPDLLF